MLESALKFWCRHFHKKVMRPVNGKYVCASCLRDWPVPWAQGDDSRAGLRQIDMYTDVVTSSSDPFRIAPSH